MEGSWTTLQVDHSHPVQPAQEPQEAAKATPMPDLAMDMLDNLAG